MSADRSSLARDLRQHLAGSGVAGLPEDWFAQVAEPEPVPTVVQEPANESNLAELDALRQEAQSCQKCRLCEQRKNVVFGVGNTNRPPIMFVGEGPGADEDRQGEPFVGKAGKLLTAAITKGLGLQREDVYIANVVKCRPPQNRTPLPDEAASCFPYLQKQIELIQPQVLVSLGSPALKALAPQERRGITKVRGQWLESQGIPLLPTFHPAYILRNMQAKRPFWEDLQTVMKHLGLPGPK